MTRPRTVGDLIDEVRRNLICDRCRRYVGSLAETTYLPPAYPVAVSKDKLDDEVGSLLTFELHMLERQRHGNFTIRHPQKGGRCVSIQEWLADGDEDSEDPDDLDEDANA
jgi:hypothetical protein